MKVNENWQQRRSEHAFRLSDHRSPFQRDRARILHSAAFRRLQAKTQVMGVGQSDFYRTRLTHSLEAAQIGSGIVAQLRSKLPDDCQFLLTDDNALIESLCLAHDIGHPPFGHGGEVALNYMMHPFGGFEGNGQTFRIVSKLEPYTQEFGMNLSRRTLLGLLKYPQVIDKLNNQQTQTPPINFRQLKANDWLPPKGIYHDDLAILEWVLIPLSEVDKRSFQSLQESHNTHHKTLYKSFDCSIMELADDIAYGIHDLEDAIVTDVVSKESFYQGVVTPLKRINDAFIARYCDEITDKLFSQKRYLQKDAIGMLVNYLITAVNMVDLNNHISSPFDEPLLRYNAALPDTQAAVLKILKDYVLHYVIKQVDIQRMEYKGQQIIMELFEAFASDPERLLPPQTRDQWLSACELGDNPQRVIADYLSGMTDAHAMKVYNSLFTSVDPVASKDHY